ncbi:ClbS/DfsB family four-helix bundle protein [Rhodobacteraceae bacterium N5(2021)]|uniref:ClbS/DfsB family four-helix bundle protein n=1 Tax=Gymnodinialimonas phycosphaerae TaxID=2841589 RepID=A0A975TTR9_9RHOB|nr:ClbS/DfsB family four-helix bundle protein [Gymnodinialimonas phycosphaerae]MBY4894826.1 ClbS/DfsB family four-helix bundle protein [Gymnodinialimonas phycosphaerae]
MPAATTHKDLLAVTDREWAKLSALLDKVPEDIACAPQGEDPSVRDILCHRAHWVGLFFQWLDEGEAAQMPDHGVKWNQLKPYNAGLRARYADLSWTEARDWLAREQARLRAWIAAADDATLYGGAMPGGTGWTRGRYAEAAGPSHCRSAAKYIRAVLKAA